MNIFSIIIDTITNQDLIAVVFSSIFITLLGFYLRKKGLLNDTAGKTLSTILLMVAIPALAFNGFMTNIDPESMRQGIQVLIWGLAIYVILIFATIPIFSKYKGDKQTVLRMLSIFGSTTFFGIPIIYAIYGPEGAMFAALFNIGYRIFLYSYCYIKMSGLKMESKNIKEMFLNPIVIATFLGLFIWLLQDFMPQMQVAVGEGYQSFAFLRIDRTIPWLHRPLTFLQPLASPLAWLAIGATLAEISLTEAAKEKASWYYTLIKVGVVPLLNLVLLVLLAVTGIMPVSYVAFATMMIMMATPAATVATAFAIGFKKEEVLASNCSLLSTIIAVFVMPIWIIVIEIMYTLGVF